MRMFKRLIIPTLYIILSLIAVFVSYRVVMTQEKFNGLSADQYQSNVKIQKVSSKHAEISNVDLKDYTKAKKEAKDLIKSGAIGKITIDKVGISLPVFQNADNTTLSIGTAQYSSDLKMGKGNYILASHNFNGTDVLLNRISQLKNDDEILVSDGTNVFKYRVSKNAVIKETEVRYLDQTRDATLTLIRCEGGFNTPFRRVVVAKQITDKTKIDNNSKPVQNENIASWKDSFYQLAVSLFSWINGDKNLVLGIVWFTILVLLTVGSFLLFK